MADDPNRRDWFDYVDKLALPLVLAFGSILFTAQKDTNDRHRAATEAAATRDRLAFDRDSGYVRMLASDSDRERDLGLKMIDALSREHRFSADLLPVVQALAAGRPSAETTQTAARILVANPVAVAARPAPTNATPHTGPCCATAAPVAVYIQIAREDQRPAARALQDALRAKGFATPGVELVPNGTVNTYVRFFAPTTAGPAATVRDVMNATGYTAATQDFVNPSRPLPSLEVWIGSKAAVTAG